MRLGQVGAPMLHQLQVLPACNIAHTPVTELEDARARGRCHQRRMRCAQHLSPTGGEVRQHAHQRQGGRKRQRRLRLVQAVEAMTWRLSGPGSAAVGPSRAAAERKAVTQLQELAAAELLETRCAVAGEAMPLVEPATGGVVRQDP